MLITRVWKQQPGKFFCISTKDRNGEWQDNFFKRSQFSEVKSFIEDNLDKDVYWCPHGFTKARRLKPYAEIPKLLWADLDEVDPRKLRLLPSIAWESSPGRFAALWVLREFMTEELNRSLTYAIGSDRGGWDLTQVLRVPNTKNHKYPSKPKVKLLWTDGKQYSVEDVQRILPRDKRRVSEGKSGNKVTAARIYKKYQHAFSGFLRRELMNGKPQKGKRSEVFWRICQEIIEAGVSEEEALELLRVCPWNKFAGRRNADEQLRREIDKAVNKHLYMDRNVVVTDDETADIDEEEPEEDEDEPYEFLKVPMSDVEEEDIDWIWYPYLAKGELTILEGDPGLGKSYLAQMIAKHIVDGIPLPTERKGKMLTIKGKVAYFDIENASGSVTKKRLSANNCRNMKNFFQEEEPFSIDDLDTLDNVHKAIEKLKPKLVVFDTLNTYIGKADIYKSSEVQQAFKHFLTIARTFDCSVLVLRHLTKGNKEKAIYRGQGSMAFTGLARFVMTVGSHPEEPETRVMAVTKINVAKKPKAVTFTINSLPDTLKDQDRSVFKWGEWLDLDADDIIGQSVKKQGRPEEKAEDVKRFLEEILEDGPMSLPKVKRAAEARSFSIPTLYRIADEMGIKKKTRGFGPKKKTAWSLPKMTPEKNRKLG